MLHMLCKLIKVSSQSLSQLQIKRHMVNIGQYLLNMLKYRKIQWTLQPTLTLKHIGLIIHVQLQVHVVYLTF